MIFSLLTRWFKALNSSQLDVAVPTPEDSQPEEREYVPVSHEVTSDKCESDTFRSSYMYSHGRVGATFRIWSTSRASSEERWILR
jgi:hypothetical protein